MKKLLLSFFILFSLTIHGQVLADWDLTADGTATSVVANVTAGTFSEGIGITTVVFASTGVRGKPWSTGAFNAANYFTTSIAPAAGYVLKVTDLNFGERRSNAGIRDYEVQYSKDPFFASPITIATVNVPDDDLERTGDISGLSIIVGDGETLYFRWYGYTAETGQGTWRINNGTLEIEGTVVLRDTDSDVGDASPQVTGGSISSLANAIAQAVDVLSIDIVDFSSGDGLPTEVSSIRITPNGTNTADWTDHIQGVVVKEGVATIGTGGVVISDTQIDIPLSSALSIADGGTKTLTIAIHLNTANIVDNAVFSCKVGTTGHGFTALATGSDFPTTLALGATSNDFTIDVEVSEMKFSTQPSNVAKNAIMSPSAVVSFVDANGNIDVDYDMVGFGLAPVTITTTGTFAAGATTTANVVAGVATFFNLIFSAEGTAETVTVTDPNGLSGSPVESSMFNITADLPVHLLYFNAKKEDQSILLSFATATEENNSHFEIEHSTNSRDFKLIGKVQGQGNSFEPLSYQFIDKRPSIGNNYYRLKQVDYDGAFEYYGPIAARFNRKDKEVPISVYPIPAQDVLHVEFPKTGYEGAVLTIFDLEGRALLNTLVEEKTALLPLNTAFLPKGSYFIRWTNGQETEQLRFIKQ